MISKVTAYISMSFICVAFFSEGIHSQDLLSKKLELLISHSLVIPTTLEIYDNKTLHVNESVYCIESMFVRTIYLNESSRDSYRMELWWKSDWKMKNLEIAIREGIRKGQNNHNCDFKNKFPMMGTPDNENYYTFPDESRHTPRGRYIEIMPTCSYLIEVTADGHCDPLVLEYTVPVCLEGMEEGKCFKCINASPLPSPIINVTVETTGVKVDWRLPKMEKEVLNNTQRIVIIIDPLRTSSSKQTRLHQELPLKDLPFGRYITNGTYFFPMNRTEKLTHQAKAFLIDVLDCHGESTEVDFEYPVMSRNVQISMLPNEVPVIWIVLVFFLLFFLVLSIIYIYIGRCNKQICEKLGNRHSNEGGFGSRPAILLPPNLAGRLVQNPMYTVQPVRDVYQIDFRDLSYKSKIGEGNFGVVYLAETMKEIQGYRKLAVKQLKQTASAEDITDFIEEMRIFRSVGYHQNIVKMLGFCKPPDPLCIVMEYVGEYNLHGYLRNLRREYEKRKAAKLNGSVGYVELQHSPSNSQISDYNYLSNEQIETGTGTNSNPETVPLKDSPDSAELEYVLDHRELESFGFQIARGMEHLEKKNIVHRDLAARNILMDNYKKLKISDFGLSRTGIYVNKKDGKFPLRWMSLEAIIDRTYSNKSDVWAYGVVLWEIGTLGAFPYPTLQNSEIIPFLQKGGHLDQPENVTAQLYDIMRHCWAQLPENRPAFSDLVQRLENLYSRTHAYVDFGNLKSNYSFPPTEEEVKKSVDDEESAPECSKEVQK